MVHQVRYSVCVALSWLLGASLALASDDRGAKPTTPAVLLKERQHATRALSKPRSDEERRTAHARLQKLPMRFLELAEANPKDPVALDALIQTVVMVNGTAFPAGGKDSPGYRTLALLRRDHVKSDKLGTVCQQVVFGFHKSHETFLRAVLKSNPYREVQALACLSLAQLLGNRLDRLDVLKDQDQPDLAERYHRVFGKEYIEELQRQDRAQVARQIEMLFARAEQFGDVKIPVTYYGSGGTVGEKAKTELFQLRHLAVGQVAPDIEGEDQYGERFKLSDYRGKVVLLDFWYHL
jgi:hypothetical protein